MVAGGLLLGVGACATDGENASSLLDNRRLVNRASHDLECADALQVTRLDAKTRDVRGCGRQATYVQLCDAPENLDTRGCVWVRN
jgi:hypothetical protein